jgi:hypothetical protein
MSEQMGDAFTYMTQDMQGKLQNYMVSLEARYGDPAAYAAQRAEMAREQAAVVHADVRTREQALSAAYAKNRQTSREAHASRMGRLIQDTHQQSQAQRNPPAQTRARRSAAP